MGKIMVTIVLGLFLVGCSSAPIKTKTEVVEVLTPILYCPATNWEELDRPSPLALEGITNNTTDGEVVQRYKATVKQLQGYIERLEKTLRQYDSTNKAYDDLKKQGIGTLPPSSPNK